MPPLLLGSTQGSYIFKKCACADRNTITEIMGALKNLKIQILKVYGGHSRIQVCIDFHAPSAARLDLVKNFQELYHTSCIAKEY